MVLSKVARKPDSFVLHSIRLQCLRGVDSNLYSPSSSVATLEQLAFSPNLPSNPVDGLAQHKRP